MGKNFWEAFFGRIFSEEFFVYIIKLAKLLKIDLFVKILVVLLKARKVGRNNFRSFEVRL